MKDFDLEILDDEMIDLDFLDEIEDVSKPLYKEKELKALEEERDRKRIIATLLHTKMDDIAAIVQTENNLYVVTLFSNLDKTYLYRSDVKSIKPFNDGTKPIRKKGGEKPEYLTEEEMTQYYLDNFKLIPFALKRAERRDGIEYEELMDVGTYGFAKALKTYDKNNGAKFSTYSVKCILNEVFYYLRKEQRKLRDTDSLYKEIGDSKDGKALTIEDKLSNEEFRGVRSVEDQIELDELGRILLDVIGELNEREQDMILNRYGLFGREMITQTQVADNLHMSQANVSKLEQNILLKLRTHMNKRHYVYLASKNKLKGDYNPNFVEQFDFRQNYIPEDTLNYVELRVCELCDLDILDVKETIPMDESHCYSVLFKHNPLYSIYFNAITEEIRIEKRYMDKQTTFLCMLANVPLRVEYTSDDIYKKVAIPQLTQTEFKSIFKGLNRKEKEGLYNRFHLSESEPMLNSELAKKYNMSLSEYNHMIAEASIKVKENFVRLQDRKETRKKEKKAA